MSNYLAIAAVTTALKELLAKEVRQEVVPEIEVTISTEHPEKTLENEAKINIFLYQVAPNATFRNMDLPTRRRDGTLIQRPQVALDLFYLFSFYGDEKKLVPQSLLGKVVSVLHSHPILSVHQMKKAIEDRLEWGDSDLAEQVDQVRLTPISLNLEELSKLWTLFTHQGPYALSVTYKASVVLIQEEEAIPKPALSVREVKGYVTPFREPLIESISPTIITVKSQLIIIKGQHLRANKVGVAFTDLATLTPPKQVSDQQITVQLPDGLRAGVNSVKVVHEIDIGSGSQSESALRWGAESNVVPFVLRPSVTSSEFQQKISKINVEIEPEVSKTQRVLLLLNQYNLPQSQSKPHAYSFNAPPNNGIPKDPQTTGTIKFNIQDVQPGEYLVRVQVDGATSLLERDKNGMFNRPKVKIE